MVLSKEDIEAAIAQSQHQDEIRHSLSNLILVVKIEMFIRKMLIKLLTY